MNRNITVNESSGGGVGSGRSLQVPAEPGLVLTTAIGGLGLEWRHPSVVSTVSRPVIVNGIECLDMDLTAAFIAAQAMQFTQTLPGYRVKLQKTSHLRTMQMTDMAGNMTTTNFILQSVIPACSRPSSAVTFTIPISNQGVKQMGCLSIAANGTVEIWPSITKNNNSWIVAPYYIEGFAISWLVKIPMELVSSSEC